MRFVPVTDEHTANKLYRPTKIQSICLEFINSSHSIIKIELLPDEYRTGAKGAQVSFSSAIKRLHLPIRAHIFKGELYLIKMDAADSITL